MALTSASYLTVVQYASVVPIRLRKLREPECASQLLQKLLDRRAYHIPLVATGDLGSIESPPNGLMIANVSG
jgi:hypothetical protein